MKEEDLSSKGLKIPEVLTGFWIIMSELLFNVCSQYPKLLNIFWFNETVLKHISRIFDYLFCVKPQFYLICGWPPLQLALNLGWKIGSERTDTRRGLSNTQADKLVTFQAWIRIISWLLLKGYLSEISAPDDSDKCWRKG